MDGALVAAGNEKIAVAIDGQAGGIHQFGDERLDAVVGGDFVERDGNFLAALPAEGDVDVAFGVDRGIADGMQVVRDLHAQRHGEGSAFGGAHAHAHRAARRALRHAREQKIVGGHDQAALRRAELNLRARVVAHAEAGALDGDFSTGKSGAGLHAFDFRRGVHVQCCGSYNPAARRASTGPAPRRWRRASHRP